MMFTCLKKYKYALLIGLTAAAVGLIVYKQFIYTSVHATPVRIAVIYADRIKQESNPYQKFEAFFNAEREKIHQEFLEKENMLRQDFETNKKKKKNKEDLKEKIKALDHEIMQRKEDFSKTVQQSVARIEKILSETIEKIVKKHGFNLVLNAEVYEKILVLYADKGFDITDAIIEELNKEKVDFK